MRIAFHTFCLNHSGGMERVLTQKANWFAKHGFDVTILTTEEAECIPFFPLHSDIQTSSLDINYDQLYNSDNVWHNIINSIHKRRSHKQKLKAYLQEHPCDIFITLQHRNFIPNLKDGSRKIFEVHFSAAAKQEFLKRKKLLYRLAYRLGSWWQERKIKYYDRFIVLTEADRRVRALPNCIAIPNSITIPAPAVPAALETKRVICVARYSYQKGLDFLIPAWKIVAQRHPDWSLHIFGRTYGREQEYTQLLSEYDVAASVHLHEPTADITSEYLNSSIYVMSSRYEGFPLVLGEAMICGVPCVSYACPYGPSDVIQDEVDGIIIPQVGDIDGLADGICRLIEDTPLRRAMGASARENIDRFDENQVMQQWIRLFDNLTS
ncbi:glycosyltransferase family 4 protein [uncultured Rikenella sp.]|uniref:glycosyltransferase family 4 protein n=2 Tax=uncultured Rikenella sp. TaxID=368003 RepID=UPI0026121B25|nr:glycosyltransferase family 4 protein [uncultured Rikenella sp.]